jgi:dTDP-glucose 4,6-dehydratase
MQGRFYVQSDATVLVTGGAGFIGSNYVRMIADQHPNWSIRVLDLLTYCGNPANLAGLEDRITFVHGDIADASIVDSVVSGCNAVVNFAAESHVDRSLIDSRPFIRTNVEGTQVLLDASRRNDVDRFLHVSTDEVYGDLAGTTHHSLESDVFRPRSPYAASKAAAEHLVHAAHSSFGLHTLITRGSNTYGPRQYPEKIIPLFITTAMEDGELPIYGRGQAVRDYMHVDDHCAGIDLVLREGDSGKAYNLGARLEINGVEVATAIVEALDKPKSLMTYVDDRPGHDYRYAVDPSAAEQLGWTRRWSFPEGLRHTVDWYCSNKDWWQPIRSGDHYQSYQSKWYGGSKATS